MELEVTLKLEEPHAWSTWTELELIMCRRQEFKLFPASMQHCWASAASQCWWTDGDAKNLESLVPHVVPQLTQPTHQCNLVKETNCNVSACALICNKRISAHQNLTTCSTIVARKHELHILEMVHDHFLQGRYYLQVQLVQCVIILPLIISIWMLLRYTSTARH